MRGRSLVLLASTLAIATAAGAATPARRAVERAGAHGPAAFETWRDAGGARWTSYTRDGGVTWSEAQAFEADLMLRDGRVAPGAPIPAAAPALQLPADGRLFLVQFATIGLPEWRDALSAMGAEVLNFFPHNAHIVRMDPKLVSSAAQLPFVARVEPYHPAYRLERTLRDWALNPEDRSARRVRVMAFEWGPRGKERILADARGWGAEVAAWFPSGHILELWATAEQVVRLAAHDEVMWIEHWTPNENDMDLARQDSGADWLESTHGICGTGVRGEVLDSGLLQTHQDFDGVLMHTSSIVDSHGTATFGIVFGNGSRDGDGNAQATGHLPSSTGCASQGIFGYYNAVPDRFVHTQQLKQSPYFASFQSNSWGSSLTTAYNSTSHQMDDIIWRLDIAITQSQSNAGSQLSRPQAWAKNIISVGGIRHLNTLTTADDFWSGASIGPAEDGRIKPDVSYWYDSVFTTTSSSPTAYTSSFGGTSAATPITAGVLGLMVQMWSDNVWNTNPTGGTVFERQPHFSTIKALLINNSEQWAFSGASHNLTRTHQGWGRPTVQRAHARAARSFVVDESQVLTVGQVASYTINVLCTSGTGCSPRANRNGEELRVTLAYPDPPGTTSSTLHRINDLSLRVVSPSGVVYHGNNGLLASRWSLPGGSPNTIDTVENVLVRAAEAGHWTVEVRAAEINQDARPGTPAADAAYALVVTGGVRVP
jgi:serine protease AprX